MTMVNRPLRHSLLLQILLPCKQSLVHTAHRPSPLWVYPLLQWYLCIHKPLQLIPQMQSPICADKRKNQLDACSNHVHQVHWCQLESAMCPVIAWGKALPHRLLHFLDKCPQLKRRQRKRGTSEQGERALLDSPRISWGRVRTRGYILPKTRRIWRKMRKTHNRYHE